MKYHLVTLGCQMNKSDSERTRTVIEGLGYRWTDKQEEANMLGILACSVRQKSIDKVYSRISRWNHWKKDRNLLTFVSGCILPADREKFLKLFDLVFTIDELPDLDSMIRQYGIVTPASLQSAIIDPQDTTKPELDVDIDTEETPIDLVQVLRNNKIEIPEDPGSLILKKDPTEIKKFWKVNPHYASDFEAFIPIQNGCDKFCTFCAVPYTRGREVSRPSADILEELRELVVKGYIFLYSF